MAPIDVEGQPSRRLALLRALRTLDSEDLSLQYPEKVTKVWLLLSSVKNTRLHAVEENILRWLLKQMSGTSEEAEQARRYPLTWTVLAHVFPKIPAQALGRSLSSLRFVSIVHRALDDTNATEPSDTTEPNQVDSRKRKRHSEPSSIEELRKPEACVKSASGIFEALATLLEQANQLSSLTPEQRVGAEHIKSLFSTSSNETRDITAGLLAACDKSLGFGDCALVRDQATWVETLTTIWDLRIHNSGAYMDFARLLLLPTCSIIARLRHVDADSDYTAAHASREIWIRQLEKFLNKCFVRPARQKFSVQKNGDDLKYALEFAQPRTAALVTVVWSAAARTPRDPNEPKSRIEHASWARAVFELSLESLESLPERKQVIVELLETAIQTTSIPNSETLRKLCKTYALTSNGTDWAMVSKIIVCDPDVFLLDKSLSEEVFARLSVASARNSQETENIITGVVLPLQDAFAKARDLPGFITHWHASLCECISSGRSLDQVIWFSPLIRERCAEILQRSLSSTQLFRLLERLQATNRDMGALLVILDGICAGLNDRNLTSSVDPLIFSMLFPSQASERDSSGVLWLRWRVAGYMASWESAEDCSRLWEELKPALKRILKKGAVADTETFESFVCCYKLCLANHVVGEHEDELIKLMSSFVGRLVSAIEVSSDPLTFEKYIHFIFRHLAKLAERPKEGVNKLPDLITDIFWHLSQHIGILESLLQNPDVMDEEAMLNALMAQPLDALTGVESSQCGWTQPNSLSNILLLLKFPSEAWTTGSRKRVMSSWCRWKIAISAHEPQNPRYASAVLRLLVAMMQHPTFYEGMRFFDLIHVCSTSSPALIEFVERFVDLALKQMMLNPDEPSLNYLREASDYVNALDLTTTSSDMTPVLIVKGLVSALDKSPQAKAFNSIISLEQASQKLAKLIEHGLCNLTSEQDDVPLSVMLRGAAVVAKAQTGIVIHLPKEAIGQLEIASVAYISRNIDLGWRLRAFLARHVSGLYDTAKFRLQLEQGADGVTEDHVREFVEAFVYGKDHIAQGQLLRELMEESQLTTGPVGPLLAVKQLLVLHAGAQSASSKQQNTDLDFASIHQRLAFLLPRCGTLQHFRLISEILLFLLDKCASSMTQWNIEMVFNSLVEVCSATGPDIQGAKAAGEIYGGLCKLVAAVVRRHRHRLGGHSHLLTGALAALLRTLLADPVAAAAATAHPRSSKRRGALPPTTSRPLWLEGHHSRRLQARHAERFARLLTLICEPSAASVARGGSGGGRGGGGGAGQQQQLDSAADAAKRDAGRYMHAVVQQYVALQLRPARLGGAGGDVPRDVRRALEPGLWAVLDVTPAGGLRVLNESVEGAGGRALFRHLFAEYKRSGKWSGV
ncbi:Urb2/Npa2 family-domain-containing protein [Xylariaceae sp. FL0804]|nr:Urb2/Npa2 family-domain-containing protein [Xylariaceae sp. FL0804]